MPIVTVPVHKCLIGVMQAVKFCVNAIAVPWTAPYTPRCSDIAKSDGEASTLASAFTIEVLIFTWIHQ
ncbi:hypothetical protein B0T16DRAFT_406467 [Cercophora newfieldiana]|uniref:Uncharacterized protein n=1 Tax=Cercophora newfieldiana TaxID=92897 RepID=A0AA39YJD1_9PEZI|nr:hypothetical protein B0T16DRAFT_406467 [Cercophora newfieldiana]